MNSLLATKFHQPFIRSDWISRPSLLHLFDAALRRQHKLILVSAPAGFGKTTLVAEWADHINWPVAWLSLDKEDNDPARFWHYIIAAIHQVAPSYGQTIQLALEGPQLPALESVVTTLINELDQIKQPFILVLDDYHFIDTEIIHNSLNFLLDHLPLQHCFVISTRVDPPLALSRRRGSGYFTEVRTADLRFSTEETAILLNTINHLDLTEADITTLDNRTEGWIVGLQLAALSLRTQPDRHAFVTAFAGDDRYIVDYLLDEVLRQQTPDIQSFLLQTSILERLCCPLCDAVTGRTDSQAVLHQLEAANLFIIPLDNRRYWYRYHHLFRDLLRHHLNQIEAGLALYHRASLWYEHEGFTIEAISQALSAHDFELASDLLERYAVAMFFRGETMLVHQWLNMLPENTRRTHPLLCAMYAHTTVHAGSFQPSALKLAECWLIDAEQAQQETSLTRSFIALSHAYLALWRNAAPQIVIDLALRAIAILPSDEASEEPNYLRFRSSLNNNLGMSYLTLGDEAAAMKAFDQAHHIGKACDDLLNAYAAVSYQCSSILRRHGQLHEIASRCQKTLDPFEGKRLSPYAGAVYINLGQVFLEWNKLEAAEHTLVKGLELVRLAWTFYFQIQGYVALAYLQQAQGKTAAMLDTLEQIDTLPNTNPGHVVIPFVMAHRVRLWLMSGNLQAAVQWADCYQLNLDSNHDEAATLIRVRIAQSRHDPSISLTCLLPYLEHWLSVNNAKGWVELLIELWMLRALVLYAVGNTDQAVAALQRAMVLAEPGGYVRVFVNEGQPMCELLHHVRAKGGQLVPYTSRLLATWRGDFHPPLFEALSQREFEILQLLAAGHSNAEIAHELVISLNTAKKHVANILQKLDVPSRVKAVKRARELGLLK